MSDIGTRQFLNLQIRDLKMIQERSLKSFKKRLNMSSLQHANSQLENDNRSKKVKKYKIRMSNLPLLEFATCEFATCAEVCRLKSTRAA
jgi:hypothetical protein